MRELVLVVLLAGCASASHTVRKEARAMARAEASLDLAVGDYWGALRWDDWTTAAAFILEDQRRLAWVRDRAAGAGLRVRDADVLQRVVLEASEGAGAHRASVVLRVQAFEPAQSVLVDYVVEQQWVERDGAWFLESQDPEL